MARVQITNHSTRDGAKVIVVGLGCENPWCHGGAFAIVAVRDGAVEEATQLAVALVEDKSTMDGVVYLDIEDLL